MANKQASVYILDHNKSMLNVHYNGCHKIASKMLEAKILSASKTDQINIIIVGASRTSNDLHTKDPSNYKNIIDLNYDLEMEQPLMPANFKLISFLNKIDDQCEHGDLLDAVIIAVQNLRTHCVSAKTNKPLKYTKKIYLLTDGQTSMKNDFLEAVEEQLENFDIQFILCAFDFELDDHEKATGTQAILSRLSLKGTFYNSQDALEFSDEVMSKSVRPTTVARLPLTFGNILTDGTQALSIDVFIYNKTSELKLPTAKKRSSVSKGMPEGGEISVVTTFYQKNEQDEDGEEIYTEPITETLKAYRCGRHLIPFGEDDEMAAKLSTKKGLEILYFTKERNVERHYYMNNVYAVVPQPDDTSARIKLESLLAAMFEAKVVAVTRFCRNDNANPKLGILKYMAKGYGYLFSIPYEDDLKLPVAPAIDFLRMEKVDQLAIKGAKSQQRSTTPKKFKKHPLDQRISNLAEANSAIDEFIDSLDLSMNEDLFKPKKTFNPTYQRIRSSIMSKAAGGGIVTNVGEELFEIPSRPTADRLSDCFLLGNTKAPEFEKSNEIVFDFEGQNSVQPVDANPILIKDEYTANKNIPIIENKDKVAVELDNFPSIKQMPNEMVKEESDTDDNIITFSDDKPKQDYMDLFFD